MVNWLILITGFISGVVLTARLQRQTLQRVANSAPPAQVSLISIIIPARNEAKTLPYLLGSLDDLITSGQTRNGVAVEVLVVNDGSTDNTVDVATAAGVTVLEAGEPDSGWVGKTWACHRGSETAQGDILIFLDADVWVYDNAIDDVVDVVTSTGGLISVQPHHETKKWYEEISAYFNVISVMAIGAFTAFPTLQPTGAFGPCLATSTRDYRAVGGHESIRGEILDDVALAQRYRGDNVNVQCLNGKGSLGYRMYPAGVGQLFEGWSKNIALGAKTTSWWLSVSTALWVTAHLLVVVVVIQLLLAGGIDRQLTIFSVVGWVMVSSHLWWSLHQLGRFRLLTSLLCPVALTCFIVIFLRSLLLSIVSHRVTWKGRTIDV